MALSCHIGKRQKIIVWKIGAKRTCETEVFLLHGFEWKFTLGLRFDHQYKEEHWTIDMHRIHPLDGESNFIITVYVPDKYGKLENMYCGRYLFPERISNTILWRRTPQVTNQHPDVEFGEGMTFVVSFIADEYKVEDMARKRVNRSSQSPPYMDVHPCLDSLMSNFKKMFEDGLYTDIELQCDKHTFNAHKAVLTARSEVFAAMLNNDMLEKQKSSIEIVDMSHQTMEEFLKYLYTGTLPEMNMDIATRLYEAGDKYAIETLKARCTHFFREHLDEANACMLFALSDAHSDEYLKEFVVSYMVRKNMLEAIKTQIKQEYPHLAFDKICQAYRTAEPYSLKK